jgi:hypothetical protein
MGVVSKADIVSQHSYGYKKLRVIGDYQYYDNTLTFCILVIITECSIEMPKVKCFKTRTKGLEKHAGALCILWRHVAEPDSAHTGMQIEAQELVKK